MKGLDYSAVSAVLAMLYKRKERAGLFKKIRLIEYGALSAMSKIKR